MAANHYAAMGWFSRFRSPSPDLQVVPAHAALDHAGGDGVVGLLINEHEAAGGAVLGIGVEEDRGRASDADATDVIEMELLALGALFERADVHLVEHVGDDGTHIIGGVAQVEAAARLESFLVGEPADHGVEFLARLSGFVRFDDHAAAAGVDLIGHGDAVA